MANASQPRSRTTSLSRRLIAITVAIAAVALLLFNSAVWFNRYIFTTANFTSTAMPAILSDASTDAVATEITDRLLQERPALRSTINDRVIKLMSALLETDLAGRLVEKSVTTLQIAITSQNPQVVAIELSGIKNVLSQVLTLGRQLTDRPVEEQRINVDEIPDQIVLLDPKNLPNIYAFGSTMLWLSPLMLLTTLGALGYPLYRAFRIGRDTVKKVLAIQGGVIIGAGLFGLAIGPLLKPNVLAPISSPNIRVVTENIIDAFITRFNDQTILLMIVPGLLFLLAALAVHLWPRIYQMAKR